MQLTREEILEKLKDILLSADAGDRDKIINADETLNLKNDFGFSSVNILFVVIAIEESFGIRFDNASMSDFEVIGDVVSYIQSKLK